MKLYIYDHCPYCLKARMIFGLKNIPVELHVLLNDDAETPTRMVGQKQVPILQKDDSRYMPESMDIVHYVDKLDGKPLLTGKRSPAIEEWLRKVNATPTNCCCRVLPNRHLMSFLLPPRANISSTRKRPARVILPTCWPTLTV